MEQNDTEVSHDADTVVRPIAGGILLRADDLAMRELDGLTLEMIYREVYGLPPGSVSGDIRGPLHSDVLKLRWGPTTNLPVKWTVHEVQTLLGDLLDAGLGAFAAVLVELIRRKAPRLVTAPTYSGRDS